MYITKNRVVTIDYELTNDEGLVLDSTRDLEPLSYLQGHDNVIPGLEAALEGKQKGEKLKVTIPAKDAYGEHDQSMLQSVPRSSFEGIEPLEVGMRFRASTDIGEVPVVISDIQGEEVTVDANHPLAGVQLHFDLTIIDVRDAESEELEHGHVHGADGHEHEH